MKKHKKLKVTICIIAPILILVVACILYFNQKPNFSAYHSYSLNEIPITDEEFQRIVEVYENDKTLSYDSFGELYAGYKLFLYKTDDMSGNYDTMYTGDIMDKSLVIDRKWWTYHNRKWWTYHNQDTARQVNAIIEEIIEKSEKE